MDESLAQNKRLAESGLRHAVNDCIEMSARPTASEIKSLDKDLIASGIITLSGLRLLFLKDIREVYKRGRVESDTEYHALRNAANTLEASFEYDRTFLEDLLDKYEQAK